MERMKAQLIDFSLALAKMCPAPKKNKNEFLKAKHFPRTCEELCKNDNIQCN